jgi:mono/diheme cytochrome c family protein
VPLPLTLISRDAAAFLFEPAKGMRHDILLLVIVVLGVTACETTSVEPPAELGAGKPVTTAVSADPLPTLSPRMVSLGEMVYVDNCASCHGVNLEGEPEWKVQNEDKSFRAPPHDESGHTWHHDDTMLMDSIRSGGARFEGMAVGGTSNMPAFEEILTGEEMVAVLAFIKSSWPEDIRSLQWQQTQRVIESQERSQEVEKGD